MPRLTVTGLTAGQAEQLEGLVKMMGPDKAVGLLLEAAPVEPVAREEVRRVRVTPGSLDALDGACRARGQTRAGLLRQGLEALAEAAP